MYGTLVFLQHKRRPSRELLSAAELMLHIADLSLVLWPRDFSDLSDVDESAEELWTALGAELLRLHRDPRGVLLTPASLEKVEAADYDSAVATYGLAGFWVPNIALEPGGFLIAGDEAEIPLPRFPRSRRLEFYVVKTARAMRELELVEEPFRTVRLELRAQATPKEVSAFYLPLLKAHGFSLKRRIWSSGVAERLVGTSADLLAVVHAERRGPTESFIQISWVQRA